MNKKYKMTFEVTCKFEDLIDEKTFMEEYDNNLLELCEFMNKEEGVMSWHDNEFKLVKAEFINPTK